MMDEGIRRQLNKEILFMLLEGLESFDMSMF
jgi:hypothetical protein